ncbi:acyl carrier protein [Streptomyces meridianus]|uniref:Acyl carrier protein n=1 Tax=Streptomyces meridianus TaxID=2938945 RepID=A0ABT0XAQ7_9ACTN|nr:acyl carrier protein [Streptomyces meridianus]MCM2579591.1 acyl carrier protein [Streptomyces meridianus]
MPENLAFLSHGIAVDDAWDSGFESLLRPFLPFLSPGAPLTPDADLRDLGLDSMGTVELLATLETTYELRFRDDALQMENFASPAVLWQTLTRAMRTTP